MLRCKCILLILFVCLLPSFCYAFDWKTLYEKSELAELIHVREALSENPDSLADLYLYGLLCLRNYRNDEAKNAFEKMLAVDPGRFEAEWGLAELLRRKHKMEQSKKVLENMVLAHSDFYPAYISLSYVYYALKDFEKSAHLARLVINKGRKHVDTANFVMACVVYAGAKGMIAHFGGPLSKVINGRVVLPYLKKAHKLQPHSAVVYFGLGSYYLLVSPVFGKDLDKAEHFLKKAISYAPYFADTYVRLAQVYLAKGNKKDYAVFMDLALDIDPDNELARDIDSGTCDFICVE